MAPLHPSFPPLAVVNKTEKRRHSNHFNLFLFLFHLFFLIKINFSISHPRNRKKFIFVYRLIYAFLSRIITKFTSEFELKDTFQKEKIKAPTGQVDKYTYQSKNNRVVFGLAPCNLERRKLP